MSIGPTRSRRREENKRPPLRWRFWVTLGFVALCLLLGGSARADVPQLLLLRPAAIVLIVVLLLSARTIEWQAVRMPALLLGALASVILLQLVPLPPGVWHAIPGRDNAVAAMQLAELGDAWHPWTLSPDQTLNSLLSLLVPAAVLLALAAMRPEERLALLPWLLAGIGINMLLCFMQLLTGASGALRFFAVTNRGDAVGVFANRNHGAIFTAVALPLAALAMTAGGTRGLHKGRLVAGAGFMGLVCLTLLAIGSRSGLAAGVIGLIWAAVILWRPLGALVQGLTGGRKAAVLALPVLLLAAVVIAATMGARDETLRRLLDPSLYADTRVRSLPTTWAMVRDLFPLGAGFGTFETMYRASEPDALLSLRYLNHAHNDYIELLIDGGIAAAAILAVFAGWSAVQAFRHLGARTDLARARCVAAAIAMMVAVASLSDYPLRTPIWMMLLAVAAVLLQPGSIEPRKNR